MSKVKISKTDAFGGISKGDELHLIDGVWCLNGDRSEWFLQDATIKKYPNLFKDKKSVKRGSL